jgi:hypothetical protein
MRRHAGGGDNAEKGQNKVKKHDVHALCEHALKFGTLNIL